MLQKTVVTYLAAFVLSVAALTAASAVPACAHRTEQSR